MSKPPAVLLQLKQENEQLRNELRNLSASLDEVLSKQAKKVANPSESNSHSVREKELQSLRTQVKNSENVLSKLRQQLEMSSTDRRAELEQEIAETTRLIREKETAIRSKAREQKHNGDRLDELTNAPSQLKEIQLLTEDVKVRRHKVEKLEAKLKQEEEAHSRARKRITELEQAIKKTGVQAVGANEDSEPQKPPVAQSDVEELKQRCEEIEKEREAKLMEWRRRIADVEGKLKQAEERKDKTLTEGEARDTVSRINENKVKELKRNVAMLQKQNEAISKKLKSQVAGPDMRIDPEAVALSSQGKHDSSFQSLRKSQEFVESKPDLRS